MSNLKVQASLTGTGVVTLTAPTTNTDRTVTLPDSSGTVVTADGSGNVAVSGAVRANNYYDASGGSNAQLYGVASPPNSMGFRNRLINSDMRIDQRNAGASVTPTVNGTYTLDRWAADLSQSSKFSVQRNAASVTPPAGFSNYLGITSLSAYTVGTSENFLIHQAVEGFNFADLNFGTASAQALTLSFWVRSSLTGTFGGSLTNATVNRCYPFSYTINAANTWEQKSVAISGDTTGTWVGATNGIGCYLFFNLGTGATKSGTAGAWSANEYYAPTGAVSVVGTNGATWYITGVQLEAGTVASAFERRDYGRELMMCQRYFEKSYALSTTPGTATFDGMAQVGMTGLPTGVHAVRNYVKFSVLKRASPTVTYYDSAGTSGRVNMPDTTTGVVPTQIFAVDSGLSLEASANSSDSRVYAHWVAVAEL